MLIGLVAGLAAGASSYWGKESFAAASAGGMQTPRMPDGHPDLSGYWQMGNYGINATAFESGSGTTAPVTQVNGEAVTSDLYGDARHGKFANFENDLFVSRQAGSNIPLYKPQFWQQVLDNQRQAQKLDPSLHCFPVIPPRLGPPTRIIQLPHEFIFFYTWSATNQFRDIPLGPPALAPNPDGTYEGAPAAHWDGDTLVVETTGYNDQTWLSRPGYIHGYDLKTIERLHRQGNEISYDVTIEDPEYLQSPWVLPTVQVKPYPEGWLVRSEPCMWQDFPASIGSTLTKNFEPK